MPLIKNQKLSEKIAYSETGNPLSEKQPPKKPNVMSVRNSNWKLIYNAHNNTKELYDLVDDPSELINLIGKNLDIEQTLMNELIRIRENKKSI
jgi:hypothetical protein